MEGSLEFCLRVKVSYGPGWDGAGNPLLNDSDLSWRMGPELDYESSDQWGYQWRDEYDRED